MTTCMRWLLLAPIVFTSCVDFIAVEPEPEPDPPAPIGAIAVFAEHETLLLATVIVLLPPADVPPQVLLDHAPMPFHDVVNGRLRFEATLAVDSLRPWIELRIRGNGDVTLLVPLLARDGPAAWSASGDLVLPLTYGGPSTSMTGLRWTAILTDSARRILFSMQSRDTPLPTRLVLNGNIVAAGTAAAEVAVNVFNSIEHNGHPLQIVLFSKITMSVPDRSGSLQLEQR